MTATIAVIRQPCESCGRLRSCQLVLVDGHTFAVCSECSMGGDAA